MKKNEQNLRDLKYRIKNKIYIVQVPRTEWDWEMGGKNFWRNNDWKLLKFDEDMNPQICSSQWTLSRIYSKRSIPRHVT